MTRTQFRNAIHDLLLGAQVDIDALEPDDWTGNFAVIGASIVSTSEKGVEQFQAALESAVNTVFADPATRAQLLGCTPTATAGDACTKDYIRSFGHRAWRRPLEAEEVDRLFGIATKAATDLGSPAEGARWTTRALLSWPNFLYRPELGAPSASGALHLAGHEMASRLAFLIWNSVPDQMLLAQSHGCPRTRAGHVDRSVGRAVHRPHLLRLRRRPPRAQARRGR